MKKENLFNIGDKVFAKVKGYPPWPAIVVEENGKKYKVKFYGTGEIGQIKVEDLFYYTKNKHKLLKTSKRKDFNDSVQEIEEAINASGTDGSPDYENDKTEESVSNGSVSTDINTDLSEKRKRSSSIAKNVEDRPSKKWKRGKVSISSGGSRNVSPTLSYAIEKNTTNVDIKGVKSKEVILTGKKTELYCSDAGDLNVEVDSKEPEGGIKTVVPDKVLKADKANNCRDTTPDKNLESMEKVSLKDYVIEKELEAFIAFGEYVEKHEDIYSKLPVENRYDSAFQNLPFFNEKKNIGIKLHQNWPLKDFKNEHERATYDKDIAEHVLKIKNSFALEQLKDTPSMFFENLEICKNDINKVFNEKLVAMKEEILENLKIEGSLLQIDSKIKNCLNLHEAEPKKAIILLEEMLKLNLNATMLKKHAHVVDMVRRLRKYVGNMERWSLTDEEKKTFRKDAEEVRKTSLKVYVKFMQIVGKPLGADTFWDAFNTIATKFREETKDLSEGEFYVLTCEPHSRKNFMNNYFIKDMSLNILFQNNVTKDIDTDNKTQKSG